jgi:hypothetical protein
MPLTELELRISRIRLFGSNHLSTRQTPHTNSTQLTSSNVICSPARHGLEPRHISIFSPLAKTLILTSEIWNSWPYAKKPFRG